MSEAPEFETLPALAGEVRITRSAPAPELPALERHPSGVLIPAAAAAGGFLAGAAVLGLVGRRRRAAALTKASRSMLLARRSGSSRRSPPAGELLQIVGSRSLLLDVHLLGGSGADR